MRQRFLLIFCLIFLVATVGLVGAASTGRAFTYSQKITVTDDGNGGSGIGFGIPIAINENQAFLGARYSNDDKGAAYYYEQLNGQWIEKQKLIASDGAIHDNFSSSISFDGNLALITAFESKQELNQRGAVYAFEQINGLWTETQKIVPDEEVYDHFGSWQTALQGNTAMIGYARNDESHVGFVNVYERINGQWEVIQTLEPPNEPSSSLGFFGEYIVFNDGIAWIVDESNNTILGYEKVNGLWTYTITIDQGLNKYAYMLWSEGDHLLVAVSNEGASYIAVYRSINGVWTEQPRLEPLEDIGHGNAFLYLDGDGETVVVGVTPYEENIPDNVRFFKVYQFINGTWVNTQTISSNVQVEPDDYLELYVGIGGNSIMASLITYPQADAVYVYTNPELVPTETSLPPTFTHTPTYTTSAPVTSVPLTPTATNTPLPDGTVELLVNSGFEIDADANKQPDGWTLKQATGDKLKCNEDGELIAFEGTCAFQFKGGDGERSKLQQDVDLATHPVTAGDTLTLGGRVWVKGDVDSKVTLKVKYATLDNDKIIVDITDAASKQWTTFTALQPSLSITVVDSLPEITLQIKNSSASGKIRFDDLSVLWMSSSAAASSDSRDLLPLP
jgi:hypothetical protein